MMVPPPPPTPSNKPSVETQEPIANTSYDIGDFSFTIPTTPKPAVLATGALYKKESRPSTGSDEERHLIAAICADSKSHYKLLTVSKNDPDMLKTTYSLTKLINLTKNHFTKYDLANPFRLVYPMASPNEHVLKLDISGKPRTSDLWTNYHHLTAKEVADSCTYYYTYGNDNVTHVISTL